KRQLHLGSKYSFVDQFASFLRSLPEDRTLILNGDIVCRTSRGKLPPHHQEILGLIRSESLRRRVVWVWGNHDENFVPADSQEIEFRLYFAIDRRLLVSHGIHFDSVMPRHRLFMLLFRFFHHFRLALGAPSVHVAQYAKKFPFLYRVLLDEVAWNAVQFAKQNGYEAVACGHTHHVEQRLIDGIRYFNTGAWTEKPLCYLEVDPVDMRIRKVVDR
ncbi:MAG: metallophosphoesterase, partial [Kiritimatiellae bacterium]|nr:metallophosphoesterase [Kiritimatiellia bacterium]